MKSKKVIFSLIAVSMVAVAALSLLWVLPTGATHGPAVRGTLVVDPVVVSPDDVNITTADRTVTIILTDPNMNNPLFVGTGPNGELPDFPGTGGAPDANGERIKIPTGQGLGTFIASLINNPIAAGGFTPLADRDDDGDIDINDLEIVLLTTGGLVAGDITVASIFNADRGQITFQVFKPGIGDVEFDLRYATAGQELSRDVKTFTETLAIPSGGVQNGEAFTLELNIDLRPLQDTNGDSIVSTADITISGVPADQTPVVTSIVVNSLSVAGLANPANGLASGDVIALVHSGDALAAGTPILVTYLGLADLITVKGSTGVPVPLRMRETGPDTGVYVGDVIAIDGSAGQTDVFNTNLDPTQTGSGQSPHIAAVHGGAITVTYTDQAPVVTTTTFRS